MKKLLTFALRCLASSGQKYFSSRSAAPLPARPQRILWIRLDHIGDGVMNMPALAALRAHFPDAHIDAVVRAPFAPLLSELNLADSIICANTPRFPNQPGLRGRLRAFGEMRALGSSLRRQYDLAIDARGDDAARLLAYWTQTPVRLGPDRIFYETDNGANLSFLMTHLTHLPAAPRHAVLANTENLKPLGVVPVEFSWPIATEHRSAATQLLREFAIRSDFAVIQARSNDPQRDWSAEKFAAIADYLISEHRLKVLLCGSAADVSANAHIQNLMKHSAAARNIAGKLTLPQLPALFELARLMVSVDTGPMHLAAMAQTPLVALMLVRLAPRHYPWNQPDAVIAAETMQDIAVAAVQQKITKRLSS